MFLELSEETYVNIENVFMIESIGKMDCNNKPEYYIRVYSDAKNYRDILMDSYEDAKAVEAALKLL